MRSSALFASAAILLITACKGQDGLSPEAFAKACAEKAEHPEFSLVGADPEWLFLTMEALHLSAGKFWEKDAVEVTKSGEHATRFFVDLREKLNAIGIQFIVVPVPPKGAIYPDKLIEGATEASVPPTAPFYESLTEAGITVIDLEAELRAARKDAAAPLTYCKTDAHPSPYTCERIATLIGEQLKAQDWAKAAAAASTVKFTKAESAEVSIKGDLIPPDKRTSSAAEKLPVSKVNASGEVDASTSPVIVIGDSHAQIFRDGGEMHMNDAGVVDHLQAELGFPVFVATSRGSAVQAQRQINKGPEFWEGRKAVVWLAAGRSLTRERKWLSLRKLPK